MSYVKYVFFCYDSFLIGTMVLDKLDTITNDLPLLGRVIFANFSRGGQ